MNKAKTLFLVEEDSTNITSQELKSKGYHVDYFYKKINKPLRALRRLWIKANIPTKLWWGSWFKEINKYDCLIINVNRLTKYSIVELANLVNNQRIIGWYWNTVEQNNYPINNERIEYWSFDEKDCNEYNFKHNIQYYSFINTDEIKKSIDIYFIGRNKGREKQINDLKLKAINEGLSCDFNIINNDSDLVTYDMVKDKLKRSKAVLEINKDNQSGFTLRCLESLFFGIKLITNNKSIISSELFEKDNIYIIGEDNRSLKEFINKPYNHKVDYLKKEFDIDKWFNNFGEINNG